MPRLNNALELFKELQSIDKYTQVTPLVQAATSAAAAAGAGSLTFGSSPVGFAAADPVIIVGSGGIELNELAAAPATNQTLKYKLAFAHDIGAVMYKALKIQLGHISDDGVDYGGTQTLTPVPSAVSRTMLAYIQGRAELTWGFALLGHNNLNLQTAFGITEAETGVGSAADPHQVVIGPTTVGSQGVQCYRGTGVRRDLKTVQVDFLDATVEVNAAIKIGATTPSPIAVAGKCGAIVQRIW